MEPKRRGFINTCFLITRLPNWAGSRQNVTGSDIEGRAVRSNEDLDLIDALDPVGLQQDAAAEDPLDTQEVNRAIADLRAQIAVFGRSVDELQTEVTALQAALAAAVAATAQPGAAGGAAAP
ncbi:hexon-associated protein [Equine adenovirus 1]|uniref:Hexon-associated protein n=1 Tax=Equine adenovirus A serotype 1 TaxID=46916 RepID=A0A1B0XBA1_ADEE1|nr:hexon-associated protein [Equine adenovirus 1]